MTAIALTIAGSDSSGGAGIQADLKTFSALGVYGASAITALTAQNTQGVQDVFAVPPDMVTAQIKSVKDDLAVNAIKIGMLANAKIAQAVFSALISFSAPMVLDPVMVAQSGDRLLDDEAVTVIRDRLMPFATLITPNLPEAAALLNTDAAQDLSTMESQARALLEQGAKAVLLKGGHGSGAHSIDVFMNAEQTLHFSSPRMPTRNTHGTGCTLSSAIAAHLAKGQTLEASIGAAKAWLTAAIISADELEIGLGAGPVHHFHAIWED